MLKLFTIQGVYIKFNFAILQQFAYKCIDKHTGTCTYAYLKLKKFNYTVNKKIDKNIKNINKIINKVINLHKYTVTF
jgi:hypothetical protein